MRLLAGRSSGFLYLVSLLGVTGARRELGAETLEIVSSVKRQTAGKKPLAVGFGISRPEHVRSDPRAGADAVIIGSSIVDRPASGRPEEEMLDEVDGFDRSLKAATRNDRTNQT
jgi:tryptophan synthase alpha chain